MTLTQAKRAVSLQTHAAYLDQYNRVYVLNTIVADEHESHVPRTMTVYLPAIGGETSDQMFPVLDDQVVLRGYHDGGQSLGAFVVRETYLRARSQRLKHATLGVSLEVLANV
jgi:hypothetical protein